MSFVFIHGGGCSGHYWDRVLGALQEPALAVNLPGRAGIPGDFATQTVEVEAAAAVDQIRAADLPDPLVVVAHSSGGMVVPAVVEALDGRVAHVVLNAALVPPDGGIGLECMKPAHQEALLAAIAYATETGGPPVILPGAPEDPETFREAYGGDPLMDDELRFMTDPRCMVPDGVHHYFQPVSWLPIASVPATYVLNELDRPIRPNMQQTMLERLPNLREVIRLDCGHIPAVTHVDAFVAAISGGIA